MQRVHADCRRRVETGATVCHRRISAVQARIGLRQAGSEKDNEEHRRFQHSGGSPTGAPGNRELSSRFLTERGTPQERQNSGRKAGRGTDFPLQKRSTCIALQIGHTYFMRGRLPSDVHLRPDDLALLERVFAQVVPEHDSYPQELPMLLVRLFQEGIKDEQELLGAARKWFS